MKTTILVLSLLCIVIGCSTLDKAYKKEVVVVTPAQTNDVTGVVTPPVLRTNLVENPTVTTTVSTLGTLPLPWAGTIAGLLAAVYSSYASARNKKVSVALINGIEAARGILQSSPEGQVLDSKVKDALIQHQEYAGVLNQVSKLVNEYTGNTVK